LDDGLDDSSHNLPPNFVVSEVAAHARALTFIERTPGAIRGLITGLNAATAMTAEMDEPGGPTA
jgi:hypothetical protein